MAYQKFKISRQAAILGQILGAIEHLKRSQRECAITLALAAEGQLPSTDKPHLLKQLTDRAPDLAKDGTLNWQRNWLKHWDENKPDEVEISTFDVAIALMRAITKFIAVYEKTHPEFEAFFKWCEAEGYKESKTTISGSS